MSEIDERGNVVAVLRGHESFESACIVPDYGRRLRCKIAYWIETAEKGAKKGQRRLVTRTTNPGEVWNKPHPGQYSDHLFMVRYENGHISAEGITDPISQYKWPVFWVSLWQFLNDDERKRVGIAFTYWARLSPNVWSEWSAELDAIRAAGVPTFEEWEALGHRAVRDTYEAKRAYVAAGGPDIRVPRWWVPTTVDLDAV
jgi:hypothetical protein